MNYEFEVNCVSCGLKTRTKFWKEANAIERVGCQPCRLARTLEKVSPFGTGLTIEKWMEKSGQGEVLEQAKVRMKGGKWDSAQD